MADHSRVGAKHGGFVTDEICDRFCVIGSAAPMRRGVSEAIWHARHRSAFGAPLVEQPAMVNVLADLALESEAATVAALRLARAYEVGGTAVPRPAPRTAGGPRRPGPRQQPPQRGVVHVAADMDLGQRLAVAVFLQQPLDPSHREAHPARGVGDREALFEHQSARAAST